MYGRAGTGTTVPDSTITEIIDTIYLPLVQPRIEPGGA